MELLDTIKDYWPVLATVSAFIAWVGALNYRVLQLEKRDPVVTITACGRQQADCQKIMAVQFSAGVKEFGEIKTMIAEERKLNEDRHNKQRDLNEERHNQLVTIILGLRDGQ